jgi:hypothetical protein
VRSIRCDHSKGYPLPWIVRGYPLPWIVRGYPLPWIVRGYPLPWIVKGYPLPWIVRGYPLPWIVRGYPLLWIVKGYPLSRIVKGYPLLWMVKGHPLLRVASVLSRTATPRAARGRTWPRRLRGPLSLPFSAKANCPVGAGSAAVCLALARVASAPDSASASETTHRLLPPLLPTYIDDP